VLNITYRIQYQSSIPIPHSIFTSIYWDHFVPLSWYSQSQKLCEVGGHPRPRNFHFFLFAPHFHWTIQVCMKHSMPVPKSFLFCFWDWKDGTSTISILLQSYCQSMSPRRCCLHPQAIAEPVWGDGWPPQPVHPAVQAVWRNNFLTNLVRGCPPRPQHLWDWLYMEQTAFIFSLF
jgi:hypothetical protein